MIGNITTSKIVQAQFYSILHKSYGLTEEPAKHEIYVAPIRSAVYMHNPPKDIEFIEDINFYLFLETEERRKYEPWWYNFNMVAKGRTLQIWIPSNWKMRIPFAGQGTRIVSEDIVEGGLVYRLSTRLPIIDYDITTREELDDNQESNNAENLEEDELFGENDLHYNKDEEVGQENDMQYNEEEFDDDAVVPDTHLDIKNLIDAASTSSTLPTKWPDLKSTCVSEYVRTNKCVVFCI